MPPQIETVAAGLVGVSTGLASFAVQSAAPATNPFVVPLLSAAVGGIVSFAVLKTTVQVVERDLREMKHDVKDIGTRLARIEGELSVGD